ncbi:MAG: hypothetical protein EOP86_06000 [Verrucomicrobiaceae bacterium]|nr:MAG: hypothetical protein EOP86_06000 [Verrucomicrobiaceae bacterium]
MKTAYPPLLLLAMAPFAKAALTNYWPLNETSGTSAASTVVGGTPAELFTGADWVNDPIRGQVLAFDGVDGHATAGTLPELAPESSFTWSFWANSSQTPNNNIILGNRYPDEGWIKFTTAAFEYRDISASFNDGVDYPDFPVDTWFHHAVVKNGHLLTYYRNGVAVGNNWTDGTVPVNTPLYFGGNINDENWAGRLDDVATWSNALSSTAIAGIYGNKYTPATAPATETIPALANLLTDSFTSGGVDPEKWEVTIRGLENNAEAGYEQPAITDGAVVLGGTTNSQYWFGSSLESVTAFDSRVYSEVSVNRVSLSGSGTAYRSSVWIFGDAGHYLHFSQNVGEGGWSYNARDDGGNGTLNPTGGGNNLEGLDPLDGDTESHVIKFRVLPTGLSNGVNIEIQVDGVVQAVHGFTNFPTSFKVILTGQGRATGDTVSAVFDDVTVAQPAVSNKPPVFSATSLRLPTATVSTAYTANISAEVTDEDGDAFTFSKVSGPAWVTVAPNGVIGGSPDASVSTARVLVRATDARGGESTATVFFRVNNPAAAAPPLFGWWPLNETSGNFGADISGGGNMANITNAATGGLGENGSVWVSDPQAGRVISFNGNDGPDAGWAVAGTPPTSGNLPVMDLSRSFTWSFWAKPAQAANNDIILGNRYNSSGADFAPAQFTKFTGSAFEWYRDGTGQNIDYDDPAQDVWAHHVVVKDGDALFYYRDGQLIDGRLVTNVLNESMPIYFGGGANGGEAWSGYLQDVRLFNGALSDSNVTKVFNDRGVYAAVNPTFTSSSYYLPSAKAGSALNFSVAPLASDPQNDALTFSKVTGPDWLSVSANGTVTGAPDNSNPSSQVVIQVRDTSGNTASSTFTFRVEDPSAGTPTAFGSWPLNDGSGSTARDTSGNGLDATISNADTGGLSDTGSVWLNDSERGTVLSFEGTDATGAQATVGTPPDSGTLPVMDLTNNFTWAFWAKPDQTANNDIILGNRYNEAGVDFAPTQFIKFTSSAFEWYVNGTQQGINYPDIETGVWAHHTVVKQGNALFYYRNGVPSGQTTITIFPDQAMPLYFGGGANGVENWRGALSNVQLFEGALSEAAVAALATPPGGGTGSLVITSVSMAANRAITLSWNGEQGKTYQVFASKSTAGFQVIGESTTGTFTFQPGNATFNTAIEPRLFFRVAEKTTP